MYMRVCGHNTGSYFFATFTPLIIERQKGDFMIKIELTTMEEKLLFKRYLTDSLSIKKKKAEDKLKEMYDILMSDGYVDRFEVIKLMDLVVERDDVANELEELTKEIENRDW